MSSMLSSALNQNLRGIIDFPQKVQRLLWKEVVKLWLNATILTFWMVVILWV